MQTPKARSGSLEVPQRASLGTPRAARQLKTTGSESDSISSSHPMSRTPKDRSPKISERRSPRSPVSEKKRPSRLSELESQLSQLQEDLKKANEQLDNSESVNRRVQQETEEAKKELLVTSAKLEESQQQLLELSASEEARVQELCKISQDRDRAWQSELEAVQKQHSVDSAALISAMNEIQRLKTQLEMVIGSKASQANHTVTTDAELQSLKLDLAKTLCLVENMKTQLRDCKESEAQAQELVSQTLLELETAKATVETLRIDCLKAKEAYNFLALELEQSKAHADSLEGLVGKFQSGLVNARNSNSGDPSGDDKLIQEIEGIGESEQLKVELNFVKLEVGQLRSAIEAAEIRYQEEQIRSMLQIQSAYELVERTKSESCLREAELLEELKKTHTNIEDLKDDLMDKETQLQSISEENEVLNMKIEKKQSSQRDPELERVLMKLNVDVTDLKANLMDKETELQSISEENETLKLEINKWEMESGKLTDEVVTVAEAARAAERETLMKLVCMTEEAEKNSRRAGRVAEQLEAAQAANTEMEKELRRLKVQTDQWRKAAEAAASILSTTGNNGKFVERSGSLDSNYHPITGKLSSPYSEDMDDDSPKKKTMLKKIGVLWKKSQK